MASVQPSAQTPPQSPSHTSTQSERRYVFTPRQFLKAQRAWERKPSTPFAPRNESQKIWKRPATKDLNGATSEIKDRHEVKRAVKRLRADETHAAEHEAMSYINTRWDEGQDEKKHKKPRRKSNRNSTSFAKSISVGGIKESPLKNGSQNVNTSTLSHDNDLHQTSSNQNHDTTLDRVGAAAISPVKTEMDSYDRDNAERKSGETDTLFELEVCQEVLPVNGQLNFEIEQKMPMDLEFSEDDKQSSRSLTPERQETVDVREHQDEVTQSTLSGGATESLPNIISLSGQEISRTEGAEEPQSEEIEGPLKVADDEVEDHDNSSSSFSEETEEQLKVGDDEVEDHSNSSPPKETEEQFKMAGDEVEDHDNPSSPTQITGSDLATHEAPTPVSEPSPSGQPEDVALAMTLEPKANQLVIPPESSKGVSSIQVDDTDYLHAFLTRAKAKKAAKLVFSPEKPADMPQSPMTRSRTALMPLSANSPSPIKIKKLVLKFDFKEDTTETLAEAEPPNGSPCRRSARTRVPKPQKGPTITPSTIPVRRSNGTEFVFLQRTEAQQIALATRSNTRHNKGEAVMPKIKLQGLTEHAPPSPIKSSPRKKSKTKEVAWDDQLAYFDSQEKKKRTAGEEASTKEEGKPKSRKMRHLGAANGTPAPKKVMAESAMDLNLNTPLPKRRGRGRA